MGLWRALTRWRDALTAEDHDFAVTFSVDIPTPVDAAIRAADSQFSDAPVRRDLAETVPAVLRGRNLMCSVSTLPLAMFDGDRDRQRSSFLGQIDPGVPNVVTLAQTIEDLVYDAVSWWRVTRRGFEGRPLEAIHVDPAAVSMQPPSGTPLRILPSGLHPSGVVWVHGQPVPSRDMIRFDSPNPGILSAAARAIRRAIVFERAAMMYANDPRPLDYFTPSAESDPVTDDEIESILDKWQQARRARSTGYVPAALTYNTADAPSPAELQLVELQRQATIDIANAFGLDSEDLQVSTTSRTYANATDRRRDRINDVLSPYMSAVTDRLSMDDITRHGYRVRFDLDDYMRADPTTRWSTYEVGLRTGVVSVGEVREMEGLPAVPVEATPERRSRPPEAGDTGSGAGPADDTEGEEAMSATPQRFSDAQHIAFDMPEADVELRVNRDRRTISGLLIPWDQVATNGMAKWRFPKGSLTWVEDSRVKLNREHDRTQTVGVATRLQSTPKGLDGSFRIARGEKGDEILSLAEDGVLDGFSIEAVFDEDGSSWARDPNDDMVRLVKSGRLTGAAITASPAFDDARVSSVAATREDRTTMPDEPNTAASADHSAEFATAVEGFTGAIHALTEAQREQAQAQRDMLDQVSGDRAAAAADPANRAQLSVTEEPMYRFDGTRGQHDFSSDMIAGAKGDAEAQDRVERWISANFTDQSDAAALNPSRHMPGMYVDQLEYATPIWDAIRKGTIPDNTPFVLPKFDSASGLVGDHTEGTEPSAGSFVTTSQTITPSAVSGRVEVTREAFDQGGNPQLSTILWRQMVRAYSEALEQAAADMLEALTGVTSITLTAGASDGDLAAEVKAAMAALHFARGGFRFRDFKLEQGLFTALAEAIDTNGRPIFPAVGPQNADGTSGQFFGAINIAGLAGIPAWALPFTDAAENNSYLFNREDVHGWASNPQRLEFQYRVAYVDVAIWGYKALATTRTDGVRRVAYDNVAA